MVVVDGLSSADSSEIAETKTHPTSHQLGVNVSLREGTFAATHAEMVVRGWVLTLDAVSLSLELLLSCSCVG
jgi:hypothetical protein